MLRLSTLRSAHELDSLSARWQALAEQSPFATMFQSFEWNRLAAKMFADREEPWVIHAVSDSGEAIIPAVRRKDELSLLGENLFDYREVLSVGAPEVLEAAFQRLAHLRLPLRVTALRGTAAELWPEANLISFCGAPLVSRTSCSAESFRRSHSRLASRARRLPRKGFALRRYDNPPPALVRDLYQRKAQQPASGELFTDGKRRQFICHVACNVTNRCTLWCYEYDSGPVAALLTFRHGGIRHFYTTWYNAGFSNLSPGQALLFEATAQTLSEGLDADFMTGESLYKNRLATAVVALLRVDATADDVAHLAAKRLSTARMPGAA